MTGISVKTFIGLASAIESVISASHKSMIVTAVYEQHIAISKSKLLSYCYGIGGDVDFFKTGEKYYGDACKPYDDIRVPGVDLIMGVDYKLALLHHAMYPNLQATIRPPTFWSLSPNKRVTEQYKYDQVFTQGA